MVRHALDKVDSSKTKFASRFGFTPLILSEKAGEEMAWGNSRDEEKGGKSGSEDSDRSEGSCPSRIPYIALTSSPRSIESEARAAAISRDGSGYNEMEEKEELESEEDGEREGETHGETQGERWSTRNTQLYPPAVCQWWSPQPVCCSICQRGTRPERDPDRSTAPFQDQSPVKPPPGPAVFLRSPRLVPSRVRNPEPGPSGLHSSLPTPIRFPLVSRNHSPPALSAFKALSLSLLGLERGRSHSISPSVSQEPEIPARDAI
ncbi:hypothetical protein EYF80_005110 [Liparis tanakae]|uniref:Uncharacterized protein n=1 Tax=Liparis tanakae TaxID=230148 RepID=A0A4Z2J2X3_9TELE|nr:hypothetical protein EYF80_005110 [Liparis tanakae]